MIWTLPERLQLRRRPKPASPPYGDVLGAQPSREEGEQTKYPPPSSNRGVDDCQGSDEGGRASGEPSQLSQLLSGPEIGGFDQVSLLLGSSLGQAVSALGELFTERSSDEMILLHLSSRTARSADGTLYFLLSDARAGQLEYAVLPANWLARQIARCRSGRVIVMLDSFCSFIGPSVSRGELSDQSLDRLSNQFPSFGRVLIASEYADQGQLSQIANTVTRKTFTGAICHGLLTGNADVDGDGNVTVKDLYSYFRDELLKCQPCQVPVLQVDEVESGLLVIARRSSSATVVPTVAALPTLLRQTMCSELASDRARAVGELGALLESANSNERHAALLALHELAHDVSLRVRHGARNTVAPWRFSEPGDPLVDRFGRNNSPGPQQMFVFIGSEVVMEQGGSWVGGHQAGGDVNQVTAGGDMTGVAAGRRNTAVGSQAHRDIETIADVKAALADLTEEVNVAEMSVAHKLQALSVLSWWQEHVDCSEEPPEARAQVVKLQSVGDWIWSRFSKIMADVPYAAAAAWLIEVAKVVAGVH